MLGKIGSSLKNAGTSALSQVSGQLEEITSKFTNIGGSGAKTDAEKNTTDLIFPIEMAGQPRPCVCFTCFAKIDNKPVQLHTWFPVPAGVQFSDSAEYNSVNLGAIGGGVASDIQAGLNAGEGFSGIAGRITNRMTSLKASDVGTIVKSANPFKDQISLATRQVKNPNTNVIFDSHPIRTFSFAFKMIAKSKDEAELIRQIHERFRHFTYAEVVNEATNFMLAFPPTWLVRFFTPDKDGNFSESIHIPRIFSCYLKSVGTNINASSVTFYNDGAPTEVDITLEFQETRALTRKDIKEMELNKLKLRGIDPNTGQPTLSNVTDPDAPQLDDADNATTSTDAPTPDATANDTTNGG